MVPFLRFIISFGSEAGDWNYSGVKPLISTWRCITLPALKAPSLYKLLSLLTNFNHTRRAWRAWLYCHGNGRWYGLAKMKKKIFSGFSLFWFCEGKHSSYHSTSTIDTGRHSSENACLELLQNVSFVKECRILGCSKCTIN